MKRWILFIGLLVSCVVGLSPAAGQDTPAPFYAARGPHPVGVQEMVIGPDDERPLEISIWYPALNPNSTDEDIAYVYEFPSIEGFAQPGRAIADAPPDTASGPYPIVVISHGLFAYRYALAYLAEQLASYGFVVMAADHTGFALGTAADPELRQSDWSAVMEGYLTSAAYAPRDVERELAFGAELSAPNGALAGLIDTEHSAVIGHSNGGYAALAAAGALVNFDTLREICTESGGTDDVACNRVESEEQIRQMAGVGGTSGETWPSLGISGVDSAIAFAPSPLFTPESLSALSVPVLLVVGSRDSGVGWTTTIYDHVSSAQKGQLTFDRLDHYFPMSECLPWFRQNQALGWCAYEPRMDIAHAHDLINHFTTAFLLSTLKGDSEATAALSPDAVAFSGIEYQAEGF